MTPNQAIELLDNLTAGIALNRADHTKVIEALRILHRVVNEPLPKPSEVSAEPVILDEKTA